MAVRAFAREERGGVIASFGLRSGYSRRCGNGGHAVLRQAAGAPELSSAGHCHRSRLAWNQRAGVHPERRGAGE